MKKIYIDSKRYERLYIEEDQIELYGINKDESAIIGNEYAYRETEDGKVGTFRTATVFISAKKAYIHDLSIINESSNSKECGQAIALYNDCEEALVENCNIISGQDTLFISPLPDKERIPGGFKGPRENYPRIPTKQIYRNCVIAGDVDFIFGSGEATFENCTIISRKRGGEVGYVAAPSTSEGKRGFYFKNCTFTSTECDEESVYLARPWREYGEAIFEDCIFGKHIKKEFFSGWNRKYQEEQHARFQVIEREEYEK